MSVLINMEMPKPGRYEAVIIVLDKSTAEIAISPAEDDIGYWKEYPLSPVPPHGRLIDADKIPYKKIMLDDDDEFYYGVTQPYIDRMPTIIPAEEATQ